MNLFQKHSEQNENSSKQVLIKVVKTNVKKYILLQIEADKILMKGSTSKSTAKELTVIFRKMLRHQSVVGECAKTAQLLFDDELDVERITGELADKYYPIKASCDCKKCKARRAGLRVMKGEKGEESIGTSISDFNLPDNAPEDLKEVFSKIAQSLKGSGLEANVRVVDVKEEGKRLGINPKDFPNFEDFISAIKKANKNEDKIKRGGKPESVINEAIIKSIEDEAQQINPEIKKDKLN